MSRTKQKQVICIGCKLFRQLAKFLAKSFGLKLFVSVSGDPFFNISLKQTYTKMKQQSNRVSNKPWPNTHTHTLFDSIISSQFNRLTRKKNNKRRPKSIEGVVCSLKSWSSHFSGLSSDHFPASEKLDFDSDQALFPVCSFVCWLFWWFGPF